MTFVFKLSVQNIPGNLKQTIVAPATTQGATSKRVTGEREAEDDVYKYARARTRCARPRHQRVSLNPVNNEYAPIVNTISFTWQRRLVFNSPRFSLHAPSEAYIARIECLSLLCVNFSLPMCLHLFSLRCDRCVNSSAACGFASTSA